MKSNQNQIKMVGIEYCFTGPCLNGGECVNVETIAGIVTSLECSCAAGWTDPLCGTGKKRNYSVCPHRVSSNRKRQDYRGA